jgi:hypothetical protein
VCSGPSATLWGPCTRKNSRRDAFQLIVVVQSTTSGSDDDAVSRGQRVTGQRRVSHRVVRQPRTEGGMWPPAVVVGDPLGQRLAQVPFVQWNRSNRGTPAGGTDQALALRIRLRRAWRRSEGLQRHGPECRVDSGREDAVSIVDDNSIGRIQRDTMPELLIVHAAVG